MSQKKQRHGCLTRCCETARVVSWAAVARELGSDLATSRDCFRLERNKQTSNHAIQELQKRKFIWGSQNVVNASSPDTLVRKCEKLAVTSLFPISPKSIKEPLGLTDSANNTHHHQQYDAVDDVTVHASLQLASFVPECEKARLQLYIFDTKAAQNTLKSVNTQQKKVSRKRKTQTQLFALFCARKRTDPRRLVPHLTKALIATFDRRRRQATPLRLLPPAFPKSTVRQHWRFARTAPEHGSLGSPSSYVPGNTVALLQTVAAGQKVGASLILRLIFARTVVETVRLAQVR